MPEESTITTLDNPYSPFTQWEEWNNYDVVNGYNTCAYLARVAVVSDELSEADYELAVDQAMQEILDHNLTGNYIRVTESEFKERMKLKSKPLTE